jgi:hypothetical protein
MPQIKKEWRIVMKNRRILVALLAIGAISLGASRAQAQEEEQKGVDQGNYNVKQSIEFGGRFTNISGDPLAYDTFVNLQQGPRLLGFTLDMNSLNHHGTWYDHFFFSNFGYGGDPNMVSRLRVSKNTWYKFDALFRKDENFWDYSLQANPINPTNGFANGPAGYGPLATSTCTACVLATSPHEMNTRRKLGDYNLIVRPESAVRLRVGYSRNIVEGPAFTTIHQGTEQFLLADVKTTVNTYRAGMDFKLLPRTNISYDQIWDYYKGDTGITDFSQPFQLNPTQNVDLGVSFNATANQPCGGTFLASGFVNPNCSAYFNGYLDHGRTRTSTPTEQLSVQSNYWEKLDLTARISYSSGDTNVFDYDQTLFGRESRTNLRNQTNTGPVFGRRVAAAADFGGTWLISDKLSFLDTFHYSNWHNPAAFNASSCSFFSPNLNTTASFFTPGEPVPLICVPPVGAQPITATSAGAHNASSAADLSIILDSNFLKQEERMNLAEIDYRFSQKLGARVGFRYRHRIIADNFYETLNEVFYPNSPSSPAAAERGPCALVAGALPAGCTLNADNSVFFVSVPAFVPASDVVPPINEYSGLFGIWARPNQKLQVSFDAELFSADGSFTRISPRESQEYRVRAKYALTSWLNLNGNALIWEARNNVTNVNNIQHNRTYGVSAILRPNDKIGLEVGYDYNDVFSQILICFTSSAVPTGPTTVNCPGVTGLAQQLSTYTNKSQYGYFDLSVTPVHRLTARLGANLTGTSGSALLVITPQVPSGSLDSKWLHPFGGFDYHFSNQWTGKAYWDYYGYHEDPTASAAVPGTFVPQDIFAPRNFRGNLVTLSVRYAF